MLRLNKELFAEMVNHCINTLPNEACGILAAREGNAEKVYATTNTEQSPNSFFMEAKEQLKIMKEMRSLRLEMLGIYHSHVASCAYPSARDVELAFYPDVSYIIISLKDKDKPKIKSFKIKEGLVREEEVKII